MQHWEDLQVGRVFETGTITISPADIIEFASEFDPQPYHLDPEVARTSIFGGHCASGWQVCALMMRLLADTMTRDKISLLGSPGVSSLRWLKPVFAGDALGASITIKSSSELPGQAEYGIIDCMIDVRNQNSASVIVLDTEIMIARRMARSLSENE